MSSESEDRVIFIFKLCVLSCVWLLIIQPIIEDARSPPSLTISSATVYPFNISSSRLTASWDISLSFKNQDNLGYGIDFVLVQAAIYYGPHFLSEASIRPFFLDSDETVSRHAKLMAHLERVDEGAAESMVKDQALRGAVDFRVVGELAWLRNFFPKSSTHFVRLSCENITVGFPDAANRPGVLLSPPPKCMPIHGRPSD